jgi:hypothetical protein
MRVFSHSNFDSVPDPMMPTFGQYNENALQRLDLALVAAAQHGIRLILVLGNYWPFLGGKLSFHTAIFLNGHAQCDPYLPVAQQNALFSLPLILILRCFIQECKTGLIMLSELAIPLKCFTRILQSVSTTKTGFVSW